ncbi:hypothetical protein Rhopal_000576-T1 [Rhodotorula paludigena]|uniref:trans-L-3-hydroxyproline dehydratase n=1 Tax=Rhodotorula paludigena TaxID=86838 RepID=A0AAV5G560_9BASI|nr:hypothetical protein Rhopal_000576-T1 [Rhodotorula paludigena]
MDVFASLSKSDDVIVCVGMHTTGEPTRIVLRGIDHLLTGERLLDKRDSAKRDHDHLRKRIMFEPRGHSEMYGAILVRETELTRAGEAHIGVLFCHNEGYSTSEQIKYDSSRLVSFLSVPSFVTAADLLVQVPEEYRWLELCDRTSVVLNLAYGGAFYAILPAVELGFRNGLRGAALDRLSFAAAQLKALLMRHHPDLTHHPTEPSLSYLYGVVLTDNDCAAEETGLCFFANQYAIGARVALAFAKGHLKRNVPKRYHSIVSLSASQPEQDAFVGEVVEEVEVEGGEGIASKGVVVKTSGRAFYTETNTFIAEKDDHLSSSGFEVSLPRL